MIEYLECLKSWLGKEEWEIELKDAEVEKNDILKGLGIEEASRELLEADL